MSLVRSSLNSLYYVCTYGPAGQTDPQTFRTQFRSVLNGLNTGLPTARIFVASIPDVTRIWALFSSNPDARNAWQAQSRCLNALGPLATDADRTVLRQRTIELNQILADECAAVSRCRFDVNALFNTAFTASDFTTIDYFHYSAAGEARVAAVTWAASFWPDLSTTRVKVVRKAGAAPASPTDGTLV